MNKRFTVKVRRLVRLINKHLEADCGPATENIEWLAMRIVRACKAERIEKNLEPYKELSFEQKKALWISHDLSPEIKARREELWPLKLASLQYKQRERHP